MAIPVAALALQMVAAAEVGLRCRKADVSACSTAGAEKLVTLTVEPGAGAGAGLLRSNANGGFGPPSTGLTTTYLVDGVDAWGDLTGSKLLDPPPEVDRMLLYMPSAQIAAGAKVDLDCPAGLPGDAVCDVWVFFYHCSAQNCAAVFQFGVTGALPGEGWTRTNCGPRFHTGVPDFFGDLFKHEMKSYRKKLAPGETATIHVPEQAEFVFFGVDVGGVDCSKLTSESTCAGAADRACVWSDKGECVATQCFRGAKGPPPTCWECPWEGFEKRAWKYGPGLA